jgi:hypothetical protein
MASGRRLAFPLAEALARAAPRRALAVGESLAVAHVGAVAATHAQALEVVALRLAVPRLRQRHRTHLCATQQIKANRARD